MNIIEALSDERFKSGELWAQPVGWAGVALRQGLRGFLYEAPSTGGQLPWICPKTFEILGEWELVEPKTVCEELQ